MPKRNSMFASAMLAWEAQQVIALRMAKLALGGPSAMHEARRMVTEKVQASAKAAGLVSAALMRGAPDGGADQVVRMLRHEVRANRRRLSQ